MWKNGNGEWETECEQGIRRGPIVAEVINNNRQPRIAAAFDNWRARSTRQRSNYVNCMRANAADRVIETQHTRGSGFHHGELVAICDFLQSFSDRICLRAIGKRNVDVVRNRRSTRAWLGGLKLRSNRHLRPVSGNPLR